MKAATSLTLPVDEFDLLPQDVQAEHLGLVWLQEHTCNGCGNLLHESMDDDVEWESHRYVCHACHVREFEQFLAQRAAGDNGGLLAGVRFYASRVTPPI